ncbi:hypothetical protein L3X38_003265 [Prunus dulcis]|uniref:Uncharacterized protein n=1 Tax=Prunus dulcis TaxID=3755 RepID=A0AAD5F1S8_PRUDU|nr:hypothetical protein L3X38_003265 [Prunus dulcis]
MGIIIHFSLVFCKRNDQETFKSIDEQGAKNHQSNWLTIFYHLCINEVVDDDLVIHILNGVGPEFKELTAVVRAHESSISFEELQDKLVEYEAALQREDTHTGLPVITKNTAQQPHSSRSLNRSPRQSFHNQSRSNFGSYIGSHHKSSGTTSFNRSPSSTTQFQRSHNTFGTC